MLIDFVRNLWNDIPDSKTWKKLQHTNLPDPRTCTPSEFMAALLADMDVIASDRAIRGKMFAWGFETLLRLHNIPYETGCTFGIRAITVNFHIRKAVEDETYHYLVAMKTSLRERWQIAELQARTLKPMLGTNRTEYYLITTRAGCDCRHLVEGHNADYMPSVDELILADGGEKLNDLIERLQCGSLLRSRR